MRGRASFLGVCLGVAAVCLHAGAGANAKLKTKTVLEREHQSSKAWDSQRMSSMTS